MEIETMTKQESSSIKGGGYWVWIGNTWIWVEESR